MSNTVTIGVRIEGALLSATDAEVKRRNDGGDLCARADILRAALVGWFKRRARKRKSQFGGA